VSAPLLDGPAHGVALVVMTDDRCTVDQEALEVVLAAQLPGVPDSWNLAALDQDEDLDRAAGRLIDLATVGRALRGPAGIRVLASHDTRTGDIELQAIINTPQRTLTASTTTRAALITDTSFSRYGLEAFATLLQDFADYLDAVLIPAVKQADQADRDHKRHS
jgi:hypothetical protein